MKSKIVCKFSGFKTALANAVRENPAMVAGLAAAAGAVALGTPHAVLAWTAPTTGSFAYDVYDVAVNKILKGPIGFVTGMGTMAAGGYTIANPRSGGAAVGVPMLLLGGALVKLDTITSSLGFLV